MKIDELRSVEQNKMMWSLLHDLARQVKWPVNGYMDYIEAEDWKAIMSAGLEKAWCEMDRHGGIK